MALHSVAEGPTQGRPTRRPGGWPAPTPAHSRAQAEDQQHDVDAEEGWSAGRRHAEPAPPSQEAEAAAQAARDEERARTLAGGRQSGRRRGRAAGRTAEAGPGRPRRPPDQRSSAPARRGRQAIEPEGVRGGRRNWSPTRPGHAARWERSPGWDRGAPARTPRARVQARKASAAAQGRGRDTRQARSSSQPARRAGLSERAAVCLDASLRGPLWSTWSPEKNGRRDSPTSWPTVRPGAS